MSSSLKRVLEDAGFHIIDHELEDQSLELRINGIVNPADLRTRAAKTLSEAGYFGYYLMEVYYFEKSKNPHRTDQYGFLEFRPGADFNRITMTITRNVRP